MKISQCMRRVALVFTGVCEWPLSFGTSYYDMNKLVLIHYLAEIWSWSSEASSDEPGIGENLCMVLWVACILKPLWRHNDSGVTESTINVNANMSEWEFFFNKSVWEIRYQSYFKYQLGPDDLRIHIEVIARYVNGWIVPWWSHMASNTLINMGSGNSLSSSSLWHQAIT